METILLKQVWARDFGLIQLRIAGIGLTGSTKIDNSRQTTPPLFGVPGRMKDAIDAHLPTGILVKNGVRKSPNQSTAVFFVDFCIQLGHAAN